MITTQTRYPASKKVLALRLKLGLGQYEFAKKADVSQWRISRIERDVSDVRLEEAQKLIEAFSLEPAFFLKPKRNGDKIIPEK